MKKIVNCTNQNVHIESITVKPGRPVFIQDDAISISFNRKMSALQQINFIKVFNEPDPIQPPVVVEPEPIAEEPAAINEVEKIEIAEVKKPVMEVIEEQKEEIQSKRKKKATTTKKQEPKEEQEDKEVE